MSRAVTCTVLAMIIMSQTAHAVPMTFDISDGLFANIPAGATGGPAVQTGAENWFYKYDPVARFGQQGSSIVRNPNTFVLMQLGRDGTTGSYGWAANVGGAINDRAVFRNGSITTRFPQSGTTQGTGVWSVAENGAQVALEWVLPSDGVVDAAFNFVGRNDAQNDIEWHLATWDGTTWTDLDFVLVTQLHTAVAPASLSATGLSLDAGDSIYLYGQIADHDAFDGTVITGGISFEAAGSGAAAVPEPTVFALGFMAMTALGIRRSRNA